MSSQDHDSPFNELDALVKLCKQVDYENTKDEDLKKILDKLTPAQILAADTASKYEVYDIELRKEDKPGDRFTMLPKDLMSTQAKKVEILLGKTNSEFSYLGRDGWMIELTY